MNPHSDVLHDLLADAARTAPLAPPEDPAALRRRATRRRTRRRGLVAGALAVTAAVAGVGLTVSDLGAERASVAPAGPPPAGPPPSSPPPAAPLDPPTAAAPSPAAVPAAPAPEPTGVPVPGPLTGAAAAEGLADLRFADEAEWATDPDFPSRTTTTPAPWAVSSCVRAQPLVPAAAAVRTVSHPGADVGSARQVAVFADAPAAASALADLRADVRACQAESAGGRDDAVPYEVGYVGGQLELGGESFWTADREVAADGSERPYSTLEVVVLEGNVVVVLSEGAASDADRSRRVAQLSAEWEQLRPQYADLLR